MKREEAELELDTVKSEINILYNKIAPLNAQLHQLEFRQQKLNLFIGASIDLCNHKWIHDGFTNHGHVRWEKCTICNTSKRT